MRTVTDEQFNDIREQIGKLPNAGNFNEEMEIILSPVNNDRGSLEFATDLKNKLETSGYENIKIIGSIISGTPQGAYEVTEGFPPNCFPFVNIYPEH